MKKRQTLKYLSVLPSSAINHFFLTLNYKKV